MSSKNPLLDEIFLQRLYADRNKIIFAKIIALNKNEEPIEQIEGQVTGGSVNLDGSSNVRRSCSLTMIAQNIDINAYYWGFKNKFKLYIGLKNNIDPIYDNIIWFPFGVMIIDNFSTAEATNGYTISISGKDKMCLLNGTLGGSLFAAHDFGKYEYYDKSTQVTTMIDIPIKEIVREAVYEYAQEPWENIIINDLEDIGLELLDYKGSKPLYLIIAEEANGNVLMGDVIQSTLDGAVKIYTRPNGAGNAIRLDSSTITYNPRTKLDFADAPIGSYTTGYYGNVLVSVAKIEYGQTCGYRYTDITYVGDLILNVGEPITSMLDKLITMLGNWEYFYDVNGKFIFQRKRTYLDKTWNNIVTNNDTSYVPTIGETYVESSLWSSAVSWDFTDGYLVTTFNNAPVLSNVKNDYAIWGTRQSTAGELPVHLRYAIDKKPVYYRPIYGTNINPILTGITLTNKGTVYYNANLAENNQYTIEYHSADYKVGDALKLTFEGNDSDNQRKWIRLHNIDTDENYSLSTNSALYKEYGYIWVYFKSNKFMLLNPRIYIDVLNALNATEYMTLEETKRRGLPASMAVDWREIIFQMAKDYRKFARYSPHVIEWTDEEQEAINTATESMTVEEKQTYLLNQERKKYGHTNAELLEIAERFPELIRLTSGKNENDEWYYPSGKTGYEQYYTDLEGFWRQLYCPPMLLPYWQDTGVWTDRPGGYVSSADHTNYTYFLSTNWVNEGNATGSGWNIQVIESPSSLNFWFDFLDADEDSDFAKYSVPMIGDRAKSVNDNMVKAIYFREVPNTIFTTDISTIQRKSGYTYIQYADHSNMSALFNISSQGKCAVDVLEEWINKYVYATESVNMTTIPVYHLQPNTRIKITDKDSKINGDYIVSRISIPLTYNGTMSVTATKVADRIY